MAETPTFGRYAEIPYEQMTPEQQEGYRSLIETRGRLPGPNKIYVENPGLVKVMGPLGAYFPRALFDTPFDYEAFAARDGLIGHGGIVVFDDSVDMAKQARFAMEFCAVESCGKCTPCRIGSTRGVETIDKIIRGERTSENLVVVEDLCNTMKFGSLCALGGFTPYPVMSALKHFREDFGPAPATLQAAE